MSPTFAETTAIPFSLETVLSVLSVTMTAYFWLIRARRERPGLRIFQLRDFRATLRRGDPETSTKRLGLTQLDSPGVLIANSSSRQTSIVRFDCFLKHRGKTLKGYWGYMEDDKPPWNIGPESTIDIRLACFFDVPEECELPEELDFRVEFLTATGHRFAHMFALKAPEV